MDGCIVMAFEVVGTQDEECGLTHCTGIVYGYWINPGLRARLIVLLVLGLSRSSWLCRRV